MDIRIKGASLTAYVTANIFDQGNLSGQVLSAYRRVENELSGGTKYLSVAFFFGRRFPYYDQEQMADCKMGMCRALALLETLR